MDTNGRRKAMVKRLVTLAAALLLLAGFSASFVHAGVPRTLLAEDYTATW